LKKKLVFSVLFVTLIFTACKKKDIDTLGGSQSAPGETDVTLSATSTPAPGVSSVSASIVSLENGVSTFSGSAVVINSTYRNIYQTTMKQQLMGLMYHLLSLN